MSAGISIVICCHNSAARLPETLNHLARLSVDAAISWEVVIVDNASTDGTGEAAKACCPESIRDRLRVVEEPEPGLSYARICGIRTARHGIISFIDDDNWVCKDWLRIIEEIFSQNGQIGVIGGPSEAVYEVPPPPWFKAIQGYYAIGPQHVATGDVTDSLGTVLWGAGMTMRKAAAESLFAHGFEFLLTGRKGSQLLSGEDIELCFALRAMGWRFHYDERLQLKHYMPKERLAWNYANRLMRGMGITSVLLSLYLVALRRHPFDKQPAFKRTWWFQFLKSAKDLALLALRHPIQCATRREGFPITLDFQICIGRLAMLFSMRPQYKTSISRLELAKWNIVKSQEPGSLRGQEEQERGKLGNSTNSTKPGVSVVICCRNSARRLPETLRHLAAQKVSPEIFWEVLLIDNASTDDTATVANTHWTRSDIPLRLVSEARTGVANARFRSFSEAAFDLISFVDDDNWVPDNWIQNVVEFFSSLPEAAAVGGPSQPAFEANPPEWFSSISSYYALGRQHDFDGDITSRRGSLLWTAGMSVRKQKVTDLVSNGFSFLQCGGSHLSSMTGEDSELCFALRASGNRLFYDNRFCITHFMPASRLVWEKALSLMWHMGLANPVLSLYLIALDEVPYRNQPAYKKTWFFQFFKCVKNAGLHLLRHPIACLAQPEGCRAVLEWRRLAGAFIATRAIRREHREFIRQIRSAPWNRSNPA